MAMNTRSGLQLLFLLAVSTVAAGQTPPPTFTVESAAQQVHFGALLSMQFGTTVSAQDAPSPAQTVLPTCDEEFRREMNYWIGRWEVVRKSDGAHFANDDVTSVLEGCALQEELSQADGTKGISFTFFDVNDRRWHQVYFDSHGSFAQVVGTLNSEGSLVLSGEVQFPGRAPRLVKMTTEPGADGTVLQYAVSSKDGGKTWKPFFDLVFKRRQ